MEWIVLIIILILVIFFVFKKTNIGEIISKNIDNEEVKEKLPFKKRDDFLSKAERSFYLTLKSFINNKALICPKIAVKELVFIEKGTGNDYLKYFNMISKKHVDFVLCDFENMNILCAVELDDSSHKAEKRKQRDEFLDRVFEAAAIKYFHLPLKFSYSQNDFIDILNIIDNKTLETKSINEITNNNIESEILSDTPICPKCQVEMVKRITSYGTNKGKAFYGCKNFPRCREIKEIAEINI